MVMFSQDIGMWKWWGKFPHSQSIIATISREFSFTTAQSPILIDAPSSSSTKDAKPPAKIKSSPIDDLRKNPNALFALLKWAEEAAANQGDSKASSKEYVTHNTYDHELFGHDEDNAPDLGENWYYLSSLRNGQKCYNVYLLVKFYY